MKSLEDGVTTPRTIRIPDSVWGEVEALASARGSTPSEVIREATEAAVKAAGGRIRNAPVIPLRAPLQWMEDRTGAKRQGHVCEAVTDLPPSRNRSGTRSKRTEDLLRTRDICEATPERPCKHAWKRQPGKWLLARVTDGPDQMQFAERLDSVRGAVPLENGSQGAWTAVPVSELNSVKAIFEHAPNRVVLHRTSV
jgi:hypothetical protein